MSESRFAPRLLVVIGGQKKYYHVIPGFNSRLDELQSQGIANAIYSSLSLHLQEVYKLLGYKPGDFPESEKAQEEVLSPPVYPELGDNKVEEIVKAMETCGR